MIWYSKRVPITFKFGSEVGFEKCSKFYWKHFLIRGPVSELGELFKIAKFKNPIFRKIKNLITFLSFGAATTIHTFLKSSDKTVIIRQGQKSDIATGQGSGAKFSLYRQTHCTRAKNPPKCLKIWPNQQELLLYTSSQSEEMSGTTYKFPLRPLYVKST